MLCDGSQDLRLRYQALTGPFADPALQFSGRNGAVYLFIDGQCQYWTFGHYASEHPTHDPYVQRILHGVLSEEQHERVALELQFDRWRSVDAQFFGADASMQLLTDGEFVIRYLAGNSAEEDRERAQPIVQIFEAAQRWVEELHTQGDIYRGERTFLHVSAAAEGITVRAPFQVHHWPLARPMREALGAESAVTLRLSGEEAQAVRGLQEQILALQQPHIGLFALDGAKYFRFAIQDELPFEAEARPPL